jgi:hypothetical protein
MTSNSPPIPADWIAHIAHTLVESARVNITLGNVRDSRDMGVSALTRQARSEPVGPPGLIAVDVSEPERGEPRRGPCARVSLVVMAVGNDGTARAEPLCGRSIQVLHREGVPRRIPSLRGHQPVECPGGRVAGRRDGRSELFRDARKPRRSTASITPFSPSRAFLTPRGRHLRSSHPPRGPPSKQMLMRDRHPPAARGAAPGQTPFGSSGPSHVVAGVGLVAAHDVRQQVGGEFGEPVEPDGRGDDEARQDQIRCFSRGFGAPARYSFRPAARLWVESHPGPKVQ